MIRTGPVAPLTADRLVGSLGTFVVQDGTEVRRVTKQAPPDAVAVDHPGAQVFFVPTWMERKTGRDVPAGTLRRVETGHAEHAIGALLVATHKGHEMLSRAERVFNDALENPIFDIRLDLQ